MASTKVALVTAGSAGLGAAIARVLFVEARMSVVINYSNNAQRAEAFVAELRGLCPAGSEQSIHLLRADLSVKNDVIKLIEDCIVALGRLDVVVSNVGS
jgi:NAD(P)-dependent dehydrogenase (short-subunit alcohol dehydrogenase family)